MPYALWHLFSKKFWALATISKRKILHQKVLKIIFIRKVLKNAKSHEKHINSYYLEKNS